MAKRSAAEVATGFDVLALTAGFLAFALAHVSRGPSGGLELQAEFDNVGSLADGAEVRVSGVPVGHVLSASIDPRTFQAMVKFTVQPDLKLPTDTSAVISTGSLLGTPFLTLSPGGAVKTLKSGDTITITQSATNLEDLLGKFIFNVGSLADATQKMLQQHGADGGAAAPGGGASGTGGAGSGGPPPPKP